MLSGGLTPLPSSSHNGQESQGKQNGDGLRRAEKLLKSPREARVPNGGHSGQHAHAAVTQARLLPPAGFSFHTQQLLPWGSGRMGMSLKRHPKTSACCEGRVGGAFTPLGVSPAWGVRLWVQGVKHPVGACPATPLSTEVTANGKKLICAISKKTEKKSVRVKGTRAEPQVALPGAGQAGRLRKNFSSSRGSASGKLRFAQVHSERGVGGFGAGAGLCRVPVLQVSHPLPLSRRGGVGPAGYMETGWQQPTFPGH